MMANLPEGAGDPPPYPAVPPASASPMGQVKDFFSLSIDFVENDKKILWTELDRTMAKTVKI